MLRIIRASPCLIPPLHGAHRRSAPAPSPFTFLRMLFEALREGLTAHRHYEELRSKGLAHDSALRQALTLAPAPARSECEGLTPLWFAGRA